MRTLPASIFCLLLSGCGSPDGNSGAGFSSAYTPNPAVNPMTEFAPHTGTQINHSPDLVQDEAYYTSHGYATLGVSSFIAGAHIDRYDLIRLAESVRADVVIWAIADADSHPSAPARESSSGTPASPPRPTVKQGTDSTSSAPRMGNSFRYTAVFLRQLR
jgi:hypothetical protein